LHRTRAQNGAFGADIASIGTTSGANPGKSKCKTGAQKSRWLAGGCPDLGAAALFFREKLQGSGSKKTGPVAAHPEEFRMLSGQSVPTFWACWQRILLTEDSAGYVT
jgi:hypothetical protein